MKRKRDQKRLQTVSESPPPSTSEDMVTPPSPPKLKTLVSTSPSVTSVPWINLNEFLEVRNCLFSPNLDKKEWGLERLSVWMCRPNNFNMKLIEVTIKLIRAQITDAKLQQQSPLNIRLEEEETLSTFYGVALIRFIALVTDVGYICNVDEKPGDQTSETRLSLLGVPAWVGHVRNELSHQISPSLLMLRNACNVALQWVKLQFWDIQGEAMVDYVSGLDCKEFEGLADQSEKSAEVEIRKLLNVYQDLQLQIRSTSHSIIASQPLKNAMQKLEVTMKPWAVKYRSIFIHTLVKPGFLVPRYDQLDAFLTSREIYQLLDEPKSIHLPRKCPSLPDSVVRFWSPILRLFFDNGASLQSLLEALIKHNGQEDPLSQKMSMAWAIWLSTMSTIGPQLDWFSLLEVTLIGVHAYSPHFLKVIYRHMEIKDTVMYTLNALVAIRLGTTTTIGKISDFNPRKNKIYTAEDVKKVFDKKLKKRNDSRQQGGNWKMAVTTLPWDQTPLGQLPDIIGSNRNFDPSSEVEHDSEISEKSDREFEEETDSALPLYLEEDTSVDDKSGVEGSEGHPDELDKPNDNITKSGNVFDLKTVVMF